MEGDIEPLTTLLELPLRAGGGAGRVVVAVAVDAAAVAAVGVAAAVDDSIPVAGCCSLVRGPGVEDKQRQEAAVGGDIGTGDPDGHSRRSWHHCWANKKLEHPG